MSSPTQLPLGGIKVLDLGHTILGPSCGMILADLGADVLKVEPAPAGDPTRRLKGFGAGYFGYFNRNKRSIAVDLKKPAGHEIALRLVERTDVLIENFGPGTMERLRLDYDVLRPINPRLIYASLKGFLQGPYEHRLALDEVVQMMSGLAYMTGPSGRPLRAGTSIVDITGGMFAVIAVLAALRERDRTGLGQRVESALFETAVFLMGQHLCYAAQSDKPVPPMPERVSAWAVYEPFAVSDGRQIFVGITSDNQWQRICTELGHAELLDDPSLKTNNDRIAARPRILQILRDAFAALTLDQAVALCERSAVPFSPITRPEDLFTDPHLEATGGLMHTRLPGGIETRLPKLPITLPEVSWTIHRDPPAIGQDTVDVLSKLGYEPEAISGLIRDEVVAAPQQAASAT